MAAIFGRAVPLFVCSHHRPRLGLQCSSINRTAPLSLFSSGPVMPCGATVRAGSLSRAVPLFVCSHHRPRLGLQCSSINRTAPLSLFSSGPVMPCGATVRAGSLSTAVEGTAQAGGLLYHLRL